MRHLIVGTTLLVVALIVTFGAASILQRAAVVNRTVTAEPFAIDQIAPAAPLTREPRSEPGARSTNLANRAQSER